MPDILATAANDGIKTSKSCVVYKSTSGPPSSYWQQRPKDFLNMDEVIDDTDGCTYLTVTVTSEMQTAAIPTRWQMRRCSSVTSYQYVNGAWVATACEDPMIPYSSVTSYFRANYLPVGRQILKCKHKTDDTSTSLIIPFNDYGTIRDNASMEEVIAFGTSGKTYSATSNPVSNSTRHIAVYNATFAAGAFVIGGSYNSRSVAYYDFHNCDFSAITSLSMGLMGVRYAYCDCSVFNFSSACTNLSYAFDGLGAYTTEVLDFSNCDFSGATNTTGMFREYNVTADQNYITTLKMGTTPAISFDISKLINLTHDSLVGLIAALPTVSTTQTFTIGSTLQAKLSAEEIAVATAKNWTVA